MRLFVAVAALPLLLHCGSDDASPPAAANSTNDAGVEAAPPKNPPQEDGLAPNTADLGGGGLPGLGADAVPAAPGLLPIALSAVPSPLVSSGMAALATIRGGASIAFAFASDNAAQIVAIDTDGVLRARYDIADSAGQELVRGFDFDADGVPDFGLIGKVPMASPKCGASQQTRTLRVFSGRKTAADAAPTLLFSTSIDDACLGVNGGDPAPYPSLAALSIHFGTPGFLAVCPQYTDLGFLFRWNGTTAETLTVVTPNTPQYDTVYAGIVRPTPQKTDGTAFVKDTQPLSGLLRTDPAGNLVYDAVSSTRVLHYAWAPLGTSGITALVSDRTYLGREHLVGRNYGLLQVDEATQLFTRVGGVTAAEVTWQMRTDGATVQAENADVAGALERGFWTYDLAAEDYHATRFLGYAYDNQGRGSYNQRVTHPARTQLPTNDGPRLVANVFHLDLAAGTSPSTGGGWEVHITNPKGVDSAIVQQNMIVWDLLPRGDGVVDVLASDIDETPVMVPDFTDPSKALIQSWIPARYYPKKETKILRWTKGADGWSTVKTIAGLPWLDLPLPNRFDALSTAGFRFGALVAKTGGNVSVWMRQADGTVGPQPIDW